MPKRTVKSAAPILSASPIPITTPLNISALARAAGVSRKTIQRRLANGWRPAAEPHAPSAAPTPRTPAHPVPAPVRILKGRDLGKSAAMPLFVPISPAVKPMPTHERPPLGVVRTVLLLLAVAFYVFVGLAAVRR